MTGGLAHFLVNVCEYKSHLSMLFSQENNLNVAMEDIMASDYHICMEKSFCWSFLSEKLIFAARAC